MKRLTIILIVTIFISCAPFASIYPQPPNNTEIATADFGTYPANYQQMIQNFMSQRLIDPYSAVYYFGEPEMMKAGNEYGYRVKVNINAKNRIGGYVGTKPYAFMIHNERIWECMW